MTEVIGRLTWEIYCSDELVTYSRETYSDTTMSETFITVWHSGPGTYYWETVYEDSEAEVRLHFDGSSDTFEGAVEDMELCFKSFAEEVA